MLIHNLLYVIPEAIKAIALKKTQKIKPLLFENMLKAWS